MEKIGRHVASQIRSIPKENRTKEAQEALDNFEGVREMSKEDVERLSEYHKAIRSGREESRLKGVKSEELFIAFEQEFLTLTGHKLSREKIRVDDYKTLIFYFSHDERFFNCINLNKKFSNPSFDKGLLIIGNYGNGKSSCMKAIAKALYRFNVDHFKYYNANTVVDMYESCKSGDDKKDFWKKIGTRIKCFDDVKTERQASNYGKIELFKDVIEKRYDKGFKTFITCNYHNDHPNDLQIGLEEFGDRYGGRVYDRLFEMFNVIEFKGGSMRK